MNKVLLFDNTGKPHETELIYGFPVLRYPNISISSYYRSRVFFDAVFPPFPFIASAEDVKGLTVWFLQDKFHHDDGPAIIYPDGGLERWYRGLNF